MSKQAMEIPACGQEVDGPEASTYRILTLHRAELPARVSNTDNCKNEYLPC